jgi:hypothetical protein
MLSDMKSKILKLQLQSKRQWFCRQKPKDAKEQVFWRLRERRLPISILLRPKNKHKFLKPRERQRLSFLRLKLKVRPSNQSRLLYNNQEVQKQPVLFWVKDTLLLTKPWERSKIP